MQTLTTAGALKSVQNFRTLLIALKRGERGNIRSEINQQEPMVRKIIRMTGTGKTLTIQPPPMIGGMIMRNVNPFDILFEPPFGMFAQVLSFCIDIVDATIGVLKSDEHFLENIERNISGPENHSMENKEGYGKRVFVVHGRDNEKKEACARILERMGLDAVILHEQPNKGKTIIEKFEEYSDVGFTVVLMTSDDTGGLKGGTQKERARQNVVFELGYFIGKLGRNRVMALVDEGIEVPTDISGVVYTGFDSQGFWKIVLAKELKEAGYNIDMNGIV